MRAHLLTSAALLAVVSASPALAQDLSPAETQIDEIIVLGEKFERSLQDTTTSVAVTTEERIAEEGIISIHEVIDRTANMSQTYGRSGFTIRGISAQGVSGAGDAPLATVYMDGAPLPNGILSNGPTDTWDITQIEVLRGPQSTLQGLNALAGAIVLRSQDPTPYWDFRARAIIADPQETGLAVAGGGPLIDGELAFRVSAESRQGDGFVYNVTRDEPEDPVDRLTLRGRLLWTPSAIPGLEARLGYTRFESSGGYPFTYTRTDTPDYFDNRISVNDSRNGTDYDADIVNLEVSYPLAAGLELISATSWSSVSEFNEYDNDGSALNLGYGFSDRDYDTWTQEFRLAYEADRVRGLLGAFYYSRDTESLSASRIDVPTPVPTISFLLQSNGLDAATADFIAGLYATALPVIPVDYAGDVPSSVTTYALFGDGEWDITDRLSLVGGFRWDHEENQTQVTQTATFIGTYPDPEAFGPVGSDIWFAIMGINMGVADIVASAGGSVPEAQREFDAFLPKLGVRYDITEDVTASFVVQRGYRSGGSSGNLARAQVFAYDPEYTWNYEASLRSTWLDGALTINANAYYVDWTDQQVSVNFGLNDFDYHTVNAGKSHLYGFEIEAAWAPTDALDIYASIGHAQTEFDDFQVGVGTPSDLSGQEFAFAPEWTLSGGATYRWAEGFIANINANYRSEVFSEVGTAQPTSEVGARTLVNTRVGWETDRWGVYAYAHNLFDEEYVSYRRSGYDTAVLGDPRVVGLILQAQW